VHFSSEARENPVCSALSILSKILSNYLFQELPVAFVFLTLLLISLSRSHPLSPVCLTSSRRTFKCVATYSSPLLIQTS
jgi:hypothetical protein